MHKDVNQIAKNVALLIVKNVWMILNLTNWEFVNANSNFLRSLKDNV